MVSIIRRNESVKGSYVIDPALRIPSRLLPPLEEGETEDQRQNLKLLSHNGSVQASIVLVEGSRPEEGASKAVPRTKLEVGSWNGNVTAKVVWII
jgi:hypothetical protein